MKRKTILIANYSQIGHYMYSEDTWSDSIIVENEKDLLWFCKNCHKESASKFNNYPFYGLFDFKYITFEKQNIIIDDNEEVFYGEKQISDPPNYFENVKKDYYIWYNNIKERLPRLRKARKKRLKEESERKKLKELSLKYNH